MRFTVLVKRNLLLFFKDRSAVFFSLMAVFVVLGLYIFFLGDLMIAPLEESLGDGARELSDNWIMAGTLGTVALTTTMSALGIMIEDRSKQITKDFYISSIRPFQVQLAYLLSSFIITMVIGVITLFLGQLYIVYYGGQWITGLVCLKVMGILALDTMMCGSFLLLLMSFFQSAPSFSNATTIIGTLSGFLMGIYIPVGALPQGLQHVISYFPPSHGVSLMRQVMMDDTMNRVFVNYPQPVLDTFQHQFGLQFHLFNHLTTALDSILIMVAVLLLFMLLMRLRIRYSRQKG